MFQAHAARTYRSHAERVVPGPRPLVHARTRVPLASPPPFAPGPNGSWPATPPVEEQSQWASASRPKHATKHWLLFLLQAVGNGSSWVVGWKPCDAGSIARRWRCCPGVPSNGWRGRGEAVGEARPKRRTPLQGARDPGPHKRGAGCLRWMTLFLP